MLSWRWILKAVCDCLSCVFDLQIIFLIYIVYCFTVPIIMFWVALKQILQMFSSSRSSIHLSMNFLFLLSFNAYLFLLSPFLNCQSNYCYIWLNQSNVSGLSYIFIEIGISVQCSWSGNSNIALFQISRFRNTELKCQIQWRCRGGLTIAVCSFLMRKKNHSGNYKGRQPVRFCILVWSKYILYKAACPFSKTYLFFWSRIGASA